MISANACSSPARMRATRTLSYSASVFEAALRSSRSTELEWPANLRPLGGDTTRDEGFPRRFIGKGEESTAASARPIWGVQPWVRSDRHDARRARAGATDGRSV